MFVSILNIGIVYMPTSSSSSSSELRSTPSYVKEKFEVLENRLKKKVIYGPNGEPIGPNGEPIGPDGEPLQNNSASAKGKRKTSKKRSLRKRNKRSTRRTRYRR
jgi:hypothetical protein